MLAYILALVVGIASLAIYLAAFFFPEIHRKNDFIWSGVGLFYALVLWIFAPSITGGLLLGHIASVALLVWFGWQTLSLRRQLTPEVQQTPVPSPELVKEGVQEQVSQVSILQNLGQLPGSVVNFFVGVKDKIQQTLSKTPAPTQTSTEQAPEEPQETTSTPVEEEVTPDSNTKILDQTTPTSEESQETTSNPVEEEVTPDSDTKILDQTTSTSEESEVTQNTEEVTHSNSSASVVQDEGATQTEANISTQEGTNDVTTPTEPPEEKLPPNPETGN